MNKITNFLKEAKGYITKNLRPQSEGKKNPNKEDATEQAETTSAANALQQEAPVLTTPQNAEDYKKVKKKTELDTAYDEVREMLQLSQISDNPERFRPTSPQGKEKESTPPTKKQEKAQETEAKDNAKDQSTNKTLTSSEKNPQGQKPAQANSMASQITTAPATPKDKAYQLGIEAGRKVGQVGGEGKKTQPPAENAGEKAPVAPAASQQMSGADPNATPTAKNENAAITPTVDATAKNSTEFKDMSAEQAQQLYPDDYQRGYNVGFDQGYLQGLQVKAQLKKEADAKQAAADKETPAYKDGYAAGTAKITGTPDAKTKGEADYKKYVQSVQAKEGDPAQASSIGEEEKKNAQLFNKGFDEAYALAYKAANDPKLIMDKKMANPDFAGGRIEGGNDAKKKAAEKFSPEEKDKLQLKPAPAGSINRSSKEYEEGYRMGFDEEYLKLYNAGIKKAENKEKNLYQSDFERGKAAGFLAAGGKPSEEKDKTKEGEVASPEPAPAAQATDKKDASKVELWYNKGFDEGYLKIWREKQKENDITNQPSYKKGQSVGKIIGAMRGMHPNDAAADAALAKNADLKAKLGGDTPPTLKGLEKYLKSKNDKLTNFKELTKEELAQLSNDDRQAYDKAIRQRVGTEKGTPAQMEDRYQLGYQKGFDEGYLKSWQAAGKAEDSKVKNNPEYQEGLKQGFEVGKKYLQEYYKNLSPDQRKTLQTQVQTLFDEAKTRGEMFEKGFKEGFEKSGNPEEKLSASDNAATSNAKFQTLVKPYQEKGDTQMVEWLNEHFKKAYDKAHKLAYDNLTESYMSAKTKPQQGESGGKNRVVQKNINQLAMAATKDKQSAQTDVLKLFKGDASDETNKELSDLVNAIDIAYKEGLILGIVEGQSFVQGFTSSVNAAKQTGGAGSGQVSEIAVQQITLRKLSDGSNETFDIKQAGNPAEFKKGQAEASKYTDAAYINERLKSQGAQTPEELELPNDSPVSEAAHKAIEDAQAKWVPIYCALNHLPVPAKIKELQGFTHYINMSGAEGSASSAGYTDLYKSPFAGTKPDKAGNQPPTVAPEEIAQKIAQEMLKQQTAIANADLELFKQQLVNELAGVAGEYSESAMIKHQKSTFEEDLRIFALQMQGHKIGDKPISFSEMIGKTDKLVAGLFSAKQLTAHDKETWDLERVRLHETYQRAKPYEKEYVAKEFEKSVRMFILGQHEPFTNKEEAKPSDKILAELGMNDSAINESLTEYKNAYNQTLQAALAGKLSAESDAENVQDSALKQCVEQMGYINGFVRYIVTNAQKDNQQKLGIQIIESYVHNKKINIGAIEGIYEGDDKVQANAEVEAPKADTKTEPSADIDVVQVIQKLAQYGQNELLVKPPKEVEAAFKQKLAETIQSEGFTTAAKDGERDAILSYSLSVQNGVAYAGNAKHQNESSGVYPKGPIAKKIDGLLKRAQNTIKKGLKEAANIDWIKNLPTANITDGKSLIASLGADNMKPNKEDDKQAIYNIPNDFEAKKAANLGLILGGWKGKTTMTAEFDKNKATNKNSLKSLGINIDAETEGLGIKLSPPKDFELASSGIKIDVGGGITLFQPRVIMPTVQASLLHNDFMDRINASAAQTTARDLKVSSSDGEKLYGGLYAAVITAVNEQEATASPQQNSSTQEPTQEQKATTPNSASAPKKNKM